MRKEIQLTQDEYNDLLTGAKFKRDRLATHIRKCALKQNEEYIKYQIEGKPLSERMKQ